MSPFDLKEYLALRKKLVDGELEHCLERLPRDFTDLREAMAHSLMAGGKRLRPILCLAGAELTGADPASVMPAACALEYIHTYSLIHDDLPAMDDDDLRRGLPTCHKKFGEGLAVLAGDALLTEAFVLLADLARTFPAQRVLRVVTEVARAAGVKGMVGGQAADLASEGKTRLTEEEVVYIHRRKTGALITVSLTSGAFLGGAGEEEMAAVEGFGTRIGAAFQIADDLLDIEGRTDILGKPTGSDQALAKATYPAAVGLEAAREKAKRLVDEALGCLKIFPEKAEPLRAMAGYIINRDK
jgi:geranylgeranyl diphosphate synthase type II